MPAIKNARGCYLGLLLLLWLLINAVTRSVLLATAHGSIGGSFDIPALAGIYFKGAINDLFPYFLLTLPLSCLLFLKKAIWGGRTGRAVASVVFWFYASVFLFGAVAETLFWDEFESRFNFIAVDYLIYTTEVIRNILESYPVIPLLAAVAASGAVIAFLLMRQFWKKAVLPAGRSRTAFTLCLVMACAAFIYTPLSSSDRLDRELSANGVWSLFSAYRHNQLDYREFYPVMDDMEAARRVHDGLSERGCVFLTQSPGEWRRTLTGHGQEWKPNVIQIVVESLGSDLLGEYTPTLNSLIPRSLFFSNLRATGTRTVRGIEALTLSVPPTPGSSIVRRPGNAGLFNIGTVFREKGYDTTFLYGGFGYFDNMNAFFSGNGFRIVDRAAVSASDITFTNAWGICDEDLYEAALREADDRFRNRQPFYQFILTTSNHRPFTYPDRKVTLPSGTGRKGAVQYTDYALGRFLEKAVQRPWFRDTVFVISGDHTSGAAGRTDLPPERYLIPALIYSPGHISPARVDTLCSQIDIPPTLFDLFGWTYRSSFFGRSILGMPPEEGRAWISTYQLLGLLTDNSLTVLAPLKEPVISSIKRSEARVPPESVAGETIENAKAWYQLAHDLFNSGRRKENYLTEK